MTLKTYKVYIFLTLGILYSVAVWKLASDVTQARWAKEKVELSAEVLKEQNLRMEISDSVAKQLETSLGTMQQTQPIIREKVIREIVKEPVYRDCVTTPTGVRIIEDAIDNKGLPSS